MSPALRVLTIGWSDRGARLRWTKGRIDDWDKVRPLEVGEALRRATLSLGIAIVFVCVAVTIPQLTQRLLKGMTWKTPVSRICYGPPL